MVRLSAIDHKEPVRVSHQAPNTVAILTRDVVAGKALELLLQSAGYSTRFILETAAGKTGDLLDGAQLLLLAPSLSARRRADFLNSMKCMPTTATIPVLELITASDGAQAEAEGRVSWPCRMEDLQREIEAALKSGLHAEPCEA